MASDKDDEIYDDFDVYDYPQADDNYFKANESLKSYTANTDDPKKDHDILHEASSSVCDSSAGYLVLLPDKLQTSGDHYYTVHINPRRSRQHRQGESGLQQQHVYNLKPVNINWLNAKIILFVLGVMIIIGALSVGISFILLKSDIGKLHEELRHATIQTNDSQKITHNGVVYVRWGRTTCMNSSKQLTELVYAGKAVGSYHRHSGAAVNYLCLPRDPIWDHKDSNINNHAFVYGTQFYLEHINVPGTPWDKSNDGHGIPRAVCKTNGRSSVLMIPGRNMCYAGWVREYHGYLGAGHHPNQAASEYQCIDKRTEVYVSKKLYVGKVVTSVEVVCDGLIDCPPYVNNSEMACVVCSI